MQHMALLFKGWKKALLAVFFGNSLAVLVSLLGALCCKLVLNDWGKPFSSLAM